MVNFNQGNPASEGLKAGAKIAQGYTGKNRKGKSSTQMAIDKLIKEKSLDSMMDRMMMGQVLTKERQLESLDASRNKQTTEMHVQFGQTKTLQYPQIASAIASLEKLPPAYATAYGKTGINKMKDSLQQDVASSAFRMAVLKDNDPNVDLKGWTETEGGYIGTGHNQFNPNDFGNNARMLNEYMDLYSNIIKQNKAK